jgi:hypothetical protein
MNANNKLAKEKNLDTTGIVNLVCRHDIPIKTGQLRHAGERYGTIW